MIKRVNVTPGKVKSLLRDLGKITVSRLILAEDLTETEITNIAGLFEPWEPGESVIIAPIPDIRQYKSKIYKCVQSHTTQAAWTPDITPALWVVITAPGVTPTWVQPDSTNPYGIGDKVIFEGHIWESTIDANVWSPTTYPAGWEDLGGA